MAQRRRPPQRSGRRYRSSTIRVAPRRARRWLVALLALTLAASLSALIAYAVDYARSRRLSAQLREEYYEAKEAEAPSAAPEATASVSPAPQANPVAAAVATASPILRVALDPFGTPQPLPYPNNAKLRVSARFTKIRRQNKDIIGWLTAAGGLLDEAVVQRDNEYYLRRDYRGYHNENGAIFLEESIGLDTRPYTLLLYGHNMKTGAMFGCLRNYENIAFYHSNPILTFDTLYEDGRYVIFSVAEVSLNMQDSQYTGFERLLDCTNIEREEILAALCRQSKHTCVVDVTAEDQVLLLITCVEDDAQRRVVAARRIREDESEDALKAQIQNAVKK